MHEWCTELNSFTPFAYNTLPLLSSSLLYGFRFFIVIVMIMLTMIVQYSDIDSWRFLLNCWLLSQVLKFNLTESGLLCVLPWLTMAVFANIGGWIADTLISRGFSITRVRKARFFPTLLSRVISWLSFMSCYFRKFYTVNLLCYLLDVSSFVQVSCQVYFLIAIPQLTWISILHKFHRIICFK